MTEQFCCSTFRRSAYFRSCALCRSQGTRSFSISPRGVAFSRFCPVRMISTARAYFCLSFLILSRHGLTSGRSKDICAGNSLQKQSSNQMFIPVKAVIPVFRDRTMDFVRQELNRMQIRIPDNKPRLGPSKCKMSLFL